MLAICRRLRLAAVAFLDIVGFSGHAVEKGLGSFLLFSCRVSA